jgi:integrase
MRKQLQPASQLDTTMNVLPFFSCATVIEDSTMRLAAFIERRFIPHHVALKSYTGRAHYQAILKHILRPETADRLFAPYMRMTRPRLKSVPDWPYLDDVRLCDLNPDHVRKLLSSALAHGYSTQTIKHIRNVLGVIISHARREQMFNGNDLISEVDLPPMVRKESHDLTIAQTKTILKLMQYPEREIALITITTGISIWEICALQWKYLNLTWAAIRVDGELLPPRSIVVKKQWSSTGVADLPASRSRVIVLPDPLIQALIKLRRHLNITDPNEYLIAAQDGSMLRPANVRMLVLKPIGRTLDIPWLSWQVLKRAHNALLLELRNQLTGELIASTRSV